MHRMRVAASPSSRSRTRSHALARDATTHRAWDMLHSTAKHNAGSPGQPGGLHPPPPPLPPPATTTTTTPPPPRRAPCRGWTRPQLQLSVGGTSPASTRCRRRASPPQPPIGVLVPMRATPRCREREQGRAKSLAESFVAAASSTGHASQAHSQARRTAASERTC
jgi:hypothetical protein